MMGMEGEGYSGAVNTTDDEEDEEDSDDDGDDDGDDPWLVKDMVRLAYAKVVYDNPNPNGNSGSIPCLSKYR